MYNNNNNSNNESALRVNEKHVSPRHSKRKVPDETEKKNSLKSLQPIEPSLLPLSERLRFFSSLSEGGANRSSMSSFTRSPPIRSIERSASGSSYSHYAASTPRSSTSMSSASVTPIPMDCAPPLTPIEKVDTNLHEPATATSATTVTTSPSPLIASSAFDQTDHVQQASATTIPDTTKSSSFLQVPKSASYSQISLAEHTPTSILTPTAKRIKLKTIGKILLPQTFLQSDRNNNTSKEDTPNGHEEMVADGEGTPDHTAPSKVIGKIKSPFIENCNQMQQRQSQSISKCMKYDLKSQPYTALASLENSAEHTGPMETTFLTGGNVVRKINGSTNGLQVNGHHRDESSADSGKENYDTSVAEPRAPTVEMRRKLTRKVNSTQSLNGGQLSRNSSSNGQQTTSRPTSLNTTNFCPNVDKRYAKYFGVALATSVTSATVGGGTDGAGGYGSSAKAKPSPQSQSQLVQPKRYFTEMPDVCQVTPQRRREDFMKEIYNVHTKGIKVAQPPQPTQMRGGVNRNVCKWLAGTRGTKRMASKVPMLKKYEDIVVTEKELRLAPKEFESLIVNEKDLQQPPMDFDRIFSSIV